MEQIVDIIDSIRLSEVDIVPIYFLDLIPPSVTGIVYELNKNTVAIYNGGKKIYSCESLFQLFYYNSYCFDNTTFLLSIKYPIKKFKLNAATTQIKYSKCRSYYLLNYYNLMIVLTHLDEYLLTISEFSMTLNTLMMKCPLMFSPHDN